MKVMRWSLEDVDVSLIDDLEIQPSGRHEESKIVELRDKIEETGVLVPLLLVRKGRRFGCFDGHRQKASVAGKLSSVQCLIAEGVSAGDRDVLFLGRNVAAVLSWCDLWGFNQPSEDKIADWILKHKAARLIDTVNRHCNLKTTSAIVKCIHDGEKFKGRHR